MSTRFLLFPALILLGLGACATAPTPLQGRFRAISPNSAVTGAQIGTPVRWGGKIVNTKPGQGQTCFELVSRPLNDGGRPALNAVDASDGRFLACHAGFYDPAVFEPGREVTIVGNIAGFETIKVGEYDYKLPKVAAEVVYLWPEARPIDVVPVYPYGPWSDPWWGGPWGPRWGGYHGWW